MKRNSVTEPFDVARIVADVVRSLTAAKEEHGGLFFPDGIDFLSFTAKVSGADVSLTVAGPKSKPESDRLAPSMVGTMAYQSGSKRAPLSHAGDLVIAGPLPAAAADRLLFDGYALEWIDGETGAATKTYTAFSGAADESLRESVRDLGPTPQGKFAIDPANIETLPGLPDWGSHRVKLEPYKDTVDHMKNCFKVIRTGMYIHGGAEQGTHGCIELNDDAEEADFFSRLAKYGKRIELEVCYTGAREKKYEEPLCPY